MGNVTDKFLYSTLTKVHGELDYPILKVLEKEVAANTTSIKSDLGGGQNGHLGLIKSPAAYTNVCTTPYVQHINLGLLSISVVSSQHASPCMLLDHKKQKRLFREMITIKKSLKNK